MVGRTKRKIGRSRQPDLEAVGLVLVAIAIFSLAVLTPVFPTGVLGEYLREAGLTHIGWATYSLPWPFLVLGIMFLFRFNPGSWPRMLTGYEFSILGLWIVTVLVVPVNAGSWGINLKAGLSGFGNLVGYLVGVLIITIGIDLMMGWLPTHMFRTLLTRLFALASAIFRSAVAMRNLAKSRAEFYADIAQLRSALQDLDRDLLALSKLFPGSSELERWRKEVNKTLAGPSKLTPEWLGEGQADQKAWQKAVKGFTRDRAQDMYLQFQNEGMPDFEGWLRKCKTLLQESFNDPSGSSAALDALRKAIDLDLTALAERYRGLSRERDNIQATVKKMSPRELERASVQHGRRLEHYGKIALDAADIEIYAEAISFWRSLVDAIVELSHKFPGHSSLVKIEERLSEELRRGRKHLLQFEEVRGELDRLERSLRSEDTVEANVKTSLEDGDGFLNELFVAEDSVSSPKFTADFESLGGEVRSDETKFAAPTSSFSEMTLDSKGVSANITDDPSIPLAGNSLGEITGSLPTEQEASLSEQLTGSEAGLTAVGSDAGGLPIQLPGLDILDPIDHTDEDPEQVAREVETRVHKIDATLANFNLQGRVVSSVRGPTVTRFEVEPAPGEKISRFANLSDDLALAMAVGSVRIEAPIPGKSVIGLEVPNANRDLINFREAAEIASFRLSKARLPLILGKSIDGEMVVADLSKMPHLLIAGSTGAGKSVAINTLIGSLLYKFLPTDLRFLMIDPKMVELTPYDGIPHQLRPVVTNPNDAADVLLGAVTHMERRYKMMSKIGAKNLDQYNEKARNLDLPEMPFIVIVIDELADLMITSPKEVESAIMRLAQMARATGMHLVLATQRPSVDILTSLIKVNVPARMAFAVSSGHDSRTILDNLGAERLIGLGDMLYYQPGLVKPVRLQGPFISENEIGKLSKFMQRQYFDDDFVEAYGVDFDPPALRDGGTEGIIDWNDDKLRVAAELVIAEGQGSVSRLQRRLQVGHARAGKLMDSLEALGVVGAHVGSKPREVLVDTQELPNIFGK